MTTTSLSTLIAAFACSGATAENDGGVDSDDDEDEDDDDDDVTLETRGAALSTVARTRSASAHASTASQVARHPPVVCAFCMHAQTRRSHASARVNGSIGDEDEDDGVDGEEDDDDEEEEDDVDDDEYDGVNDEEGNVDGGCSRRAASISRRRVATRRACSGARSPTTA
jgi:hypothetical protein